MLRLGLVNGRDKNFTGTGMDQNIPGFLEGRNFDRDYSLSSKMYIFYYKGHDYSVRTINVGYI